MCGWISLGWICPDEWKERLFNDEARRRRPCKRCFVKGFDQFIERQAPGCFSSFPDCGFCSLNFREAWIPRHLHAVRERISIICREVRKTAQVRKKTKRLDSFGNRTGDERSSTELKQGRGGPWVYIGDCSGCDGLQEGGPDWNAGRETSGLVHSQNYTSWYKFRK